MYKRIWHIYVFYTSHIYIFDIILTKVLNPWLKKNFFFRVLLYHVIELSYLIFLSIQIRQPRVYVSSRYAEYSVPSLASQNSIVLGKGCLFFFNSTQNKLPHINGLLWSYEKESLQSVLSFLKRGVIWITACEKNSSNISWQWGTIVL